jgi:hypothetical protein
MAGGLSFGRIKMSPFFAKGAAGTATEDVSMPFMFRGMLNAN